MTSGRSPSIRVFADPESLGRAAADFILNFSRWVLASRGRFSFALSGGSTPKKLYSLLAASPWRDEFTWSMAHFFWSDERCVPPDHAESNYKLAFDSFLSRVPPPPQNVHRIHGEEGPDKAARVYEEELQRFFGRNSVPAFDLVLLGAGGDGHTASLFPGAPEIQEQKRLALPVHLEPPRLNRVTLSLPVLNNAVQVLFLAAGSSKAGVVRQIIREGNPEGYPAGLVRPVHGSLMWMLDHDAARELRGVQSDKNR